MARERMITRTIEGTTVTAICMDVTTMQGTQVLYSLSAKVDNDTALKYLKKHHETETFKIVAIKNSQVYEKLFGMYEDDFIKNAIELDPETRKPLKNGKEEKEIQW